MDRSDSVAGGDCIRVAGAVEPGFDSDRAGALKDMELGAIWIEDRGGITGGTAKPIRGVNKRCRQRYLGLKRECLETVRGGS